MINHFFKKTSVIISLLVLCSVAGLKAQTLEEAITAANNEQYDKAEQILTNLAKSAPSSKVFYRLGENALLNFFADSISNSLKTTAVEAKQQFEKGISLNPNDPLNYVGLAKVAAYQGDLQTATQMRAKAKSFFTSVQKGVQDSKPAGICLYPCKTC